MPITRLLLAALLAVLPSCPPAMALSAGFDKGSPRVAAPLADAGQQGGETTDDKTPDAPAAPDLDIGKLTEEQVEEVVQFVLGNAIFIMFHEAGHMLISELGLPVLGREEDAVDVLSAILLLEGRDETLDKAITDSADGWFLSGEKMAEDEDYAFWDSHGLDEQRAYQTVCMMVGHDAEGFKEFADSIEFPADRREECAGEFAKARESWFTLLAPHMVDEGKKSTIKVSYEPAVDEDMKAVAEMLKTAELLENAAGMFADLYKLEDGISFTARSCGEPNAYWHPAERQVTFCYELSQFHMALITEWFINNPDE